MGISIRQWLFRSLLLLSVLACLYLLYLLTPLWKPLLISAAKISLPFLIAGLFAYLLHPFIDLLQKRGLHRAWSVLLIYLIFFGGGAWLLVQLAPYLLRQYIAFTRELPGWLQMFENQLISLHRQIDTLPSFLHDQIENGVLRLQTEGEEMMTLVVDHWRYVLEGVAFIFLLPFVTFYLLKDLQAFEKAVAYLTPKKWQKQGARIVQAADRAFGNYIRGQLMVSVCVGTLSIVALWIVGVPYPVVLGLFMGIMDLIPYFGPVIGAVPALIVAATISWKTVLFALLAIFIIQQVESNVLSPFIVGKSAHLHPLLILLALLVGYEFAGIIGLLIAVPVFVIIGEVVRSLNEEKRGEQV